MATFSSAVVVGTFDGYGEPAWNTRNGERPTGSEIHSVLILRPVRINPKSALRGDRTSVLGARVVGGHIGCHSDRFSDELVLEPGASYVFFIQPEWDSVNARSMDPWVLEAWPMGTQKSVRTPLEGEVAISTLAKVLAHTPRIRLPTSRPTRSP